MLCTFVFFTFAKKSLEKISLACVFQITKKIHLFWHEQKNPKRDSEKEQTRVGFYRQWVAFTSGYKLCCTIQCEHAHLCDRLYTIESILLRRMSCSQVDSRGRILGCNLDNIVRVFLLASPRNLNEIVRPRIRLQAATGRIYNPIPF